ncbi:MAG: cobalt-zinc-cadmium resistance protein CzcA [Cyclobacteriaceae bacterium]|jgi:cobalt-zinc-cadmium resistance protein CzcA
MLSYIIQFSLKNKLIILLFTFSIVAFGIYSLLNIPIGAVPDVTNNQVQVITTSRDLSTQDVEQFITYPVELEMANLPGVKEIRSISKFGLSVVTIVFEDDMGTYLPRQLIAEKIKTASDNIPAGFGSPEMGPITTGLGEIYQYVLEVEPEYKGKYSTMELRTIQDWIVKRQLSGIPGVVEVNTWGGFLKQYEVAINPDKLRAMNLSLVQVFQALEMNNSLTGGGYIEKGDQAYFIRGEGLTQSIEDIENIVVENRDGLPVYIRDVAKVGFGHATRFGAVTSNGDGEKVLGQVMMLKDANSKAVIEAVKERVAEIQHTLPEGIFINPILERSELIGKTTNTIAENLILGCLIVVFVVVLLLGSVRTGLVVASVIPLCLLFAIGMMYIFGVDANLMSLGAIDFGIIIDGAVIIVEYIAFKITSEQAQLDGMPISERKSLIDRITFNSTNKMMHSAIFGQLIIIIVFIPILSLINVEGKMFKPMALTFCFALIGAMIFCFTYVPVISSMFLKPGNSSKNNFSGRLISWLQARYEPILSWALNHTKLVMGSAVGLLMSAVFLFSTLGGEFVPTLDEGDFVIQPVLETGTSLSRTVEITTKIEQVIRDFPEVNQVVTRIGAAEVPTDPMSMEETDVIITLHPKSQWQTAGSKDELADNIKNALKEAIPNVDYEFTQPIEMRFNELITGVRADLAIKIFGEDLEVLAQKGEEIAEIIKNVAGASDIVVEKIEGLPQMSVVYDRAKIARYRLNISEVNDVISMGFAGKIAGSIFEGEKRFDLVIRYDQDHRRDIENLKNAVVTTPNGLQIPLHELADISYGTGPAKISRDDTRRRIVVSVNVRNRDLESVVDDVRALVNSNIFMPAGFYVTYGGQFENLQSARERLTYAVPVALVLIFILLYFAFKSAKEAFMIYTAIPLSAVGGVFFLWMRDMPFSISAGVGFIALFGIAVLNGIVLIEHYKELKEEGFDDFKDLIIKGTVSRLRPVLLTASAAAMGFLPMAISTSVGAEVQRPLATVVIGGLVSATILTLIVLPVLYYSMNTKQIKIKPKLVILLLLMLPIAGYSQTPQISLEQAITTAKENNAQLRAQGVMVEKQEVLKGSAFDFDKTNVYYNYDESNIARNNQALKVWGIQQKFSFPTTYGLGRKLNEAKVELEKRQYAIDERVLEEQVSKSYYHITYLLQLEQQYLFLDSTYAQFSKAADRRFELGASNSLEQLTAKSQQNAISLQLSQVQKDLAIGYSTLQKWMQTVEPVKVAPSLLNRVTITEFDSLNHPVLQYLQQERNVNIQAARTQKSKWLPDIQLEYFQGTNNGINAQNYAGFQVGLGIPLLYGAQKSRVRASQLNLKQTALQREDYRLQLLAGYRQLSLEVEKHQQVLENYKETGKPLSESLIRTANRSFESGEIDFFQYIQTLDRAVQIQIDYLENLNFYNKTALSLNYLMN